jgi:hypothetical protein
MKAYTVAAFQAGRRMESGRESPRPWVRIVKVFAALPVSETLEARPSALWLVVSALILGASLGFSLADISPGPIQASLGPARQSSRVAIRDVRPIDPPIHRGVL